MTNPGDKTRHRGPGPKDKKLFGPEEIPLLRSAVSELSWLLTRGYPIDASLALVGNRYDLVQRQRIAVRRCACSDQQLASRLERQRSLQEAEGKILWVDGFNHVITLETALGGGAVLRGRDGCLRDLAELRGSYRIVAETAPALDLLLQTLGDSHPSEVHLLLDRPVSNSGRLRSLLLESARGLPFDLQVELVPDPDPLLVGVAKKDILIATADSVILDACGGWVDLLEGLALDKAWILDLGEGVRPENSPS
ncbi:MAG TPA: DUF434 domain-containing protein [Planctomycetes bacterium]|nr:DUF434 domain-containing protein [Planctomycetota bacterium]